QLFHGGLPTAHPVAGAAAELVAAAQHRNVRSQEVAQSREHAMVYECDLAGLLGLAGHDAERRVGGVVADGDPLVHHLEAELRAPEPKRVITPQEPGRRLSMFGILAP